MSEQEQDQHIDVSWLTEMEDGVIRVNPISVGEQDRKAGRVLEFLYNDVLEGQPMVSEAEGILEAALWWLRTVASNYQAARILDVAAEAQEEKQNDD